VIQLERPRDITALFGDSLGVYFRHAGVFIALSAAVVVPVYFVVQGIGLEQFTASFHESPSLAEAAVPTAVRFLVVAPLITAICIYALRSVAQGGRPGAGESFVSGFEAFTPLFLAVLLAALGIALGLLLLIVPGIYVAVRWFFVPQTVVLDAARGTQALARSSQIVEGFWWRTLGLVIMVNLAAIIPGIVLAAPFTAIASSTDRAVWAMVGTICAEAVTTPFVALFSTLLYYDLRARRALPAQDRFTR
jgi:hypothetical protein